MIHWKSRFVMPLLSGVLFGLSLLSAHAQAEEMDRTSAPVVVYPVVFYRDSGTDTSRSAAIQALREVMSKAGHPVLSNTVASAAWRKLRIPVPTRDSVPTTRELTRFGRAMKARYVLTAGFDFHSRSIWVNVGPKTISTATANVSLFDVEERKVVYSRKKVQGRSDEKTETLKLVADVLVTPLVSAVSGGPKTPQERRAAQIAAAKALHNWVRPGEKTDTPGSGQKEKPKAEKGTSLSGSRWTLQEIAYNDDKIVRPDGGEKMTIAFGPGGQATGNAGINRFNGKYTAGKDRSLKVGPLALTRAANPPGSIADTYVKELERAKSYLFDKGMLVLQLPLDTGVLKFAPIK